MDRRSFVRLSTIGAAFGIIAPSTVLSSVTNMAGGVYYTKDAPGRWSKKVEGHLPLIDVSKNKIEVTTPHGMHGFEHYIVKHMILDEKFEYITEKMFNPEKDKSAISVFDLADYSGKIHVISVCNKHDSWLNIANV